MIHARWVAVLIMTVVLVISPVVAVTAVSVDATGPTDNPHISPNSADADSNNQARSPPPGTDTIQAPTDTGLVDIAPAESPGSETSDDPYVITSGMRPQAIDGELDATHRLGAEVDVSDTVGWHGGDGFDPIGRSSNTVSRQSRGTFDGPGFSVDIISTNAPVTETEPVSVDARIENTGDVGGIQSVSLDLGALGTVSRILTLSTGENTTETFSVPTTAGDAGDYTATLSSENDTDSTDVTVLAPANLSVDLDATNAPVVEGNTLNVDARIENTGDVSGTQNVSLDAGALGTDSASVTLPAGERTTETLLIPTAVGDAGEYTATLSSENDTDSTDVTVLAPANFSVEINATASPVIEGDTLKIDAKVENTGDVGGTQTVSLDAGTLGTDSASVTLPAGENTTETLSVSVGSGDAGEYTATVSLENDTANTAITVLAPAEFSVSGVSAPASVIQSETVTVNATVRNTGNVSGTVDLTFVFTGSVLSNESVTLEEGTTTDVSFEVPTTDVAPGTYEYGVQAEAGGQFANITIQQPATFEVSNLSAPDSAVQAETIFVNATVSNVGDVEATIDTGFAFGGDILLNKPVTVDGGNSTTVSFEISTEGITPGSHEHGVQAGAGSQFATIVIQQPATFEVTTVEAPETATVNDTINITATLKNVAEVSGSATISITFGNSIVSTQQVSLNSSESGTVSATLSTVNLIPSNYTYGISIDNPRQSDQITIEEQDDGANTGAPGQPGFGIGIALAALIAVVLFARRR